MEFYEVDFLEAGERCSGDAIALRYGDGVSAENVHVVDGGYTDDGEKLLNHIAEHYDQQGYVDHVVLTHPDGDHACGLKHLIRETNVGFLWMNRPWQHVDSLLPMFEYPYTRDGLIQRLKADYPHTAELEQIAIAQGIQINDAFQGATIGSFVVLAPTRERYLDLVIHSDKTPEPERKPTIGQQIVRGVVSAARYATSFWGEENLKGHIEGTSHENEMSIVQYAEIAGDKILLTGDAGVEALEEAHQYATALGVPLPGINRFHVPHHGSRRNLSPEILDKWLGPKLPQRVTAHTFTATVSANASDPDHPRKAVVRALMHRGAGVTTTEGQNVHYWFRNKPIRAGFVSSPTKDYPEDMEE